MIFTEETGLIFEGIINFIVNILRQMSVHKESFNHGPNNDFKLHNFPHKPSSLGVTST
jgi:hypothetical protein